VVAIVAAAAALAAGAVVGVTLLQTRGESTGSAARKGAPPLYLVVTGPLHRALTLYQAGKRTQARAIFVRYRSLPAEIGAAFSSWPHGSLDAVEKIVAEHPKSGLAELHLGLADYWSGRDADALSSWKLAATLEPDTPAAVTALDLLHPNVVPGLPYIVVDVSSVHGKARLPLERGILAWDREHPVSAKRELDAAAALAPDDPAVLTAAAVAGYSPAHPLRPFPALGPLSGRFPKAAVVRLHLGLLLLWTKQITKAESQLRAAIALQPGSAYARSAKELLDGLVKDGTK
jgi:tetratricopeptide (TPR) repeat protein